MLDPLSPASTTSPLEHAQLTGMHRVPITLFCQEGPLRTYVKFQDHGSLITPEITGAFAGHMPNSLCRPSVLLHCIACLMQFAAQRLLDCCARRCIWALARLAWGALVWVVSLHCIPSVLHLMHVICTELL